MTAQLQQGPVMNVGIMDHRTEIVCCLNGDFACHDIGTLSGKVFAKAEPEAIVLADERNNEIARSSFIRLISRDDASFTLMNVIIGINFHWERREDQTFQGNLILKMRDDGTIAVINEIHLEAYLRSVISSEMNPAAPPEFLKAHAILSRSWLLRALERKKETNKNTAGTGEKRVDREEEITHWYEQEDHDLFDVCADDHCQRYQGITKLMSERATEAVRETCGRVITYDGEICDARFSKACGGLTDNFGTAWADKDVPYLISVSDGPTVYGAVRSEDDAVRWISSRPDAYCDIDDPVVLESILPDFDRETATFFRWKVDYSRRELEEILREKSGFDFGTLREIMPLSRGPSGRIYRLRIAGSKKSVVVGKELEIRRWLSRSHLYSSAFVVITEYDTRGDIEKFIFHGAGWGHGVGLCQIGAAVMAVRGFSAEDILKHYFPGTEIRNIY